MLQRYGVAGDRSGGAAWAAEGQAVEAQQRHGLARAAGAAGAAGADGNQARKAAGPSGKFPKAEMGGVRPATRCRFCTAAQIAVMT